MMPMKQPTDMPTDRPKEQSIDMGYGKMKPDMLVMATLEGAHSVFKDIALKSGNYVPPGAPGGENQDQFPWCSKVSPVLGPVPAWWASLSGL